MKTRRTIIMILTLCVALSFTACTGKGDSGKADSASVSEGTDKTEDLQAKLDDLYQQENQIFEKHKDVWEKVFSKMSKADAGSDNYAEYLAATVESNKNSFTDDELKTLKEGQTYSSLDLEEERMAKGKRKAETVDIEMMFIQETHKSIQAIADADTTIFLFLEYPETTASVDNKPLVQSVKCTVDIAGQEMNDGDFIKDTMRVYKESKVVETDGYPVEGDSTKY